MTTGAVGRQALDEFLRVVPLFRDMGDTELGRVAEATTGVDLPAGHYVFRRDDPGDTLYVITDGVLEAVLDEDTPDEQVVNTLGPGDFFGEIALMTGRARTRSVRAARDSHLVALDRNRFHRLLAQDHALSLQLNRVLSDRLTETTAQLSRRGARMSVLVHVGDPHMAGRVVEALTRSLRRQFDVPTALVYIDVRCDDAHADGVERIVIDHAARVTDSDIAAELGALRRRFGQLVVRTSLSLALGRPAALARADTICILACTREARAAASSIGRDLLEATGRVPRLAFVAERGATAAWLKESVLRPIRLEPRTFENTDRLARALGGCTVGLALSGGAAQGVAHLGVLEALSRGGVPVDLIAGTSGGSLYGSLVASGMQSQEAQRRVVNNTRKNLRDRADFALPTRGIIRGARIEQMVRDTIGDLSFDDLKTPLYAVATDLDTGKEVVLNDGPVYAAVRASISVPGLFEPYHIGSQVLVDGGVVNPLPVSVARERGADFVIAVQVPAPGKASDTTERMVSRRLLGEHNLLTTVVRAYYFAGDVLADQAATSADVLIKPAVARFGWRDYRSSPEIMREGLRAGREALPRVAAQLPIRFGAGLINTGIM